MVLLNLPLIQLQQFLFVFVRVSAILFTIPFLSARNVPVILKSGLALAVSVLLMSQLNLSYQPVAQNLLTLVMGLAAEIGIGLIIGTAVQLLFAGVQLAGQIAGFQMGFAIANVMDPASSLQIPVLSQFLNLFAMMIMLTLNMHFFFIKALVEAFERIPPWGVHFDGKIFEVIMALIANVFVIAVKIGAPVIVALLLISVALGLIARTVPQMQIFIVAMPLKILLGLLFLCFCLPYCATYLHSAFIHLGETMLGLIALLH